MDVLIAILLIIDLYAIVFFRLMCSHYYQEVQNRKESAFAAIFSFPPHRQLNAKGKKYSQKYWVAIGVLLIIVILLARSRDYSQLGTGAG